MKSALRGPREGTGPLPEPRRQQDLAPGQLPGRPGSARYRGVTLRTRMKRNITLHLKELGVGLADAPRPEPRDEGQASRGRCRGGGTEGFRFHGFGYCCSSVSRPRAFTDTCHSILGPSGETAALRLRCSRDGTPLSTQLPGSCPRPPSESHASLSPCECGRRRPCPSPRVSPARSLQRRVGPVGASPP